MTDQQKQQITEMRKKGIGYGLIADTLDVPISAVKSYCRRHVSAAPIQFSAEPLQRNTQCKRCGADLINTPGHRQKTFCTNACQRKYWQEHTDLMRHCSYVEITCPACGKSFSDYAGHHRKYCSHACYIQARYGKGDVNGSERNNLSCNDDTAPKNDDTRLADRT